MRFSLLDFGAKRPMLMHIPPLKNLIKKIGSRRKAPSPKENVFCTAEGKPYISKITAMAKGCPSLEMLDELFVKLGGLKKIIRPGDKVLIKINLSSPHPPPATTDPGLVMNIAKLLKDYGAGAVHAGDYGGPFWLPSRGIVHAIKLDKYLEKAGAESITFDDGPWTAVDLGSSLLPPLAYPSVIYDYDRVIYLANLKTHFAADFTCALKLTMGFLHLRDRFWHLHTKLKLKKGLADINKAVYPDLVIIDGRKAFVEGGPVWGKIKHPGVIIASGNRVAADFEALRTLSQFNECKSLKLDHPTIQRAIDIGLGEDGVLC